MDSLYKIVGKKLVGNGVKLIITQMDFAKNFDTTKILRNLGGFMEEMKSDAVKSRDPDSITITREEYDKGGYELGNTISVSINAGE
jgi:hypothetical protein